MEKISEYNPTAEELEHMNKEALREYEIKIKFLNRGCIVSVGCKEIAFERVEDAISALQTYVTWPHDQQKAWRKILE